MHFNLKKKSTQAWRKRFMQEKRGVVVVEKSDNERVS